MSCLAGMRCRILSIDGRTTILETFSDDTFCEPHDAIPAHTTAKGEGKKGEESEATVVAKASITSVSPGHPKSNTNTARPVDRTGKENPAADGVDEALRSRPFHDLAQNQERVVAGGRLEQVAHNLPRALAKGVDVDRPAQAGNVRPQAVARHRPVANKHVQAPNAVLASWRESGGQGKALI